MRNILGNNNSCQLRLFANLRKKIVLKFRQGNSHRLGYQFKLPCDWLILLSSFLLYVLFIRWPVEKTIDSNRPIAVVGIEKVATIAPFDRFDFRAILR